MSTIKDVAGRQVDTAIDALLGGFVASEQHAQRVEIAGRSVIRTLSLPS